MAPVTRNPTAILVSHGAPSDPLSQEVHMQKLARRVRCYLPKWSVRSATLAEAEALPKALAGVKSPLIYPMFMAEGWFTQSLLPRKIHTSGCKDARILDPFGTNPAIHTLCANAALEGAAHFSMKPETTDLLLAAHGSPKTPETARSAHEVLALLRETTPFASVSLGFIDQEPSLAFVAAQVPDALCLPFFASHASHVATDIPDMLASTGFRGRLLDPIGTHTDVPQRIAQTLLCAIQKEAVA